MEPQELDQTTEISGTKVMIGSAFGIFLIGTIFWAGATFNRVQAMEQHVSSIDAKIDTALSKIGDVETLGQRQSENEHRIEKLEDIVRQLR